MMTLSLTWNVGLCSLPWLNQRSTRSALGRVLVGLDRRDSSAWGFGIPVILVALASSILINPSTRGPIHGLPGFVGFFLWHSLLGGIDVARRALHPKMPLAPALVDFPLRLDDQAAITLLIYMINLLPRTIVVEFEERRLGIHVLDRRLAVFEFPANGGDARGGSVRFPVD